MSQLAKILIYVGCWLIGAIVELTILLKIKANNKEKTKKLELARIIKQIPELVTDAEEYIGTGNGFAKLNYVLNKIHIMCIEKGLSFDEEGFEYEIEKVLETPQKKQKSYQEQCEISHAIHTYYELEKEKQNNGKETKNA